jgi:hypothetical protein
MRNFALAALAPTISVPLLSAASAPGYFILYIASISS